MFKLRGSVRRQYLCVISYFGSKLNYRTDGKTCLRVPSLSKYRLKRSRISEQNFIFVDTETLTLNGKSDIIQLAAISSPNQQMRNECINFYCRPSSETRDPTKRADIENLGSNSNEMVKIVPIGDALQEFIKFIERNVNDSSLRKAILIAHNAFCDSKVIVEALIRNQMFDSFNKKVFGFIDTLQLFRKFYPNLSHYSQPNLVSYFLKGQYNAHNARDDCHLLQQLYAKALSPIVSQNLDSLSKTSFNMKYALLRYKHNLKIQTNFSTFEPMIEKKLINRNVAKKLAINGLTVPQLKTLLIEKGIQRLEEVLTQVFGTKNIEQNFFQNIIRYLHLK